MKTITTISAKRQITLPKDLLEKINLEPNGKVVVEDLGETVVLKPLRTSVTEELAASLTKYVNQEKLGVSLNKILSETRKKTAQKLAGK